IILARPLIEALLFSLAIAVGIAPEMMPAIVTVSLSSGSRALAAKKVLIKRLVAIEDLGELVPADVRFLSADQCECDEGVLTGESLPVSKTSSTGPQGDDATFSNCAYMGTIVRQGSAQAVVILTGTRTAFGRIATGVTDSQGQSAFEMGLAKFSRFLFLVAALLTVFIFAANIILARPLIEALLFSLAIAVGIAPEMMPAIVTVSLSSGSRALRQEGPDQEVGGDRGPRQHRTTLH
ncbi:MAG: hypothetical protein ABSG09_09335, partial [Acidimicrobiales bacterium]